MINLDIALLHHPVTNKVGDTIGSAITNLDLHDIARTARTYGVNKYYVISPYEDQHDLVNDIIDHWLIGHGASYNPARKEALSLVNMAYKLEEVYEQIKKQKGFQPYIVATSAKRQKNEITFEDLRKQLQRKSIPVLLLFGTAHGIAREVITIADATLEPILGRTDYNHLSVRSAVSIILDRLLGI